MSEISAIKLQGSWQVCLSGLLFGSISYLVVQLIHQHLSVTNILFWRFFIAFIWTCSFFAIQGFTEVKQFFQTPRWFYIILYCACTYSLASLLYFAACLFIATGYAMTLFFCFPLFVMFYSCVVDRSLPSKMACLVLISMLLGLFFLQYETIGPRNLTGTLLAMSAAAFYALYVFGNRNLSKKIRSQTLTFILALGCSVLFYCMARLDHSFFIPTSAKTWLYILALSILGTAFPIQLLLRGMKYITPNKASILSLTEPLATIFIGSLFLHEQMTAAQYVGVFFVLLSGIIIQFERQKPYPTEFAP